MSTKKILLVGCGALTAVSLLLLVLFVLFVMHVTKDPEGMRLAVNAPATVARGNEFELVVNVVNERPDKTMKVSDIDIGEAYLKGFTVVSSKLPSSASTKNGLLENRTYTFNQTILPNRTNAFVFKLIGRETGKYTSEIQVSEGMRMLTMVVETQVE